MVVPGSPARVWRRIQPLPTHRLPGHSSDCGAARGGSGTSQGPLHQALFCGTFKFRDFPHPCNNDVTDREFERSNLFLRTMSQVPGRTAIGRSVFACLLLAASPRGRSTHFRRSRVCEVLAEPSAHEGKELAVLGRFSFRREGRWIASSPANRPAPSRRSV